MSNSALANFISRKSGNYFERTSLVTKIMLHNPGEPGDRYTMAEYINTSEDAGYHYGISTDGVIGLFIDEFRAAKGCSNDSINNECIHIIIMQEGQIGASSQSGVVQSVTQAIQSAVDVRPITVESYDALINLLEDICRRNFISSLSYTGTLATSNILLHRWVDTENHCPGIDIQNRMPAIVKDVNNRLKNARIADEAEAEKVQSTIPVGATHPYVICPEPGVTGINYITMREAGVVGTVLHAGSMRNSKYVNPSLGAQVNEANSGHMPFGLYCDVTASSDSEARAECRELYYVISRYSPKLGIWLYLDTSADGSTLQTILTIYYENIVRWGLKGRCGIMATTSQAHKANYKLWIDKFAFWWVDHIRNTSALDNVLTPSLFKL